MTGVMRNGNKIELLETRKEIEEEHGQRFAPYDKENMKRR